MGRFLSKLSTYTVANVPEATSLHMKCKPLSGQGGSSRRALPSLVNARFILRDSPQPHALTLLVLPWSVELGG